MGVITADYSHGQSSQLLSSHLNLLWRSTVTIPTWPKKQQTKSASQTLHKRKLISLSGRFRLAVTKFMELRVVLLLSTLLERDN